MLYVFPDLNSQPTEATYALLVGNELLPEQKTTLQHSRVIHLSRDPSLVQAAGARPKEEEDEGAASAATAEDPDRVITNARIARPDDGLLSDDELMRLYRSDGRRLTLRSAYDEALSAIVEEKDYVFGTREPSATCGKNEPMYTSYTHFWQLTLGQQLPTNSLVSILVADHWLHCNRLHLPCGSIGRQTTSCRGAQTPSEGRPGRRTAKDGCMWQRSRRADGGGCE